MVARMDDWSDRVSAIEKKVDSLATSVRVRFEDVAGALLEQRRYTEFAFNELNTRIGQLEERMESSFAHMDSRFAQVDSHFARLERKLDQLIDRA
jgi:tetrahydromethanopterin S-methyltransferase subunit G